MRLNTLSGSKGLKQALKRDIERGMKMNAGDTLLIGHDFSHGKYNGILTVGKQIKGKVEIINVLQGKEAWDLYQKLITVNAELK
jgi:hypothetical protein